MLAELFSALLKKIDSEVHVLTCFRHNCTCECFKVLVWRLQRAPVIFKIEVWGKQHCPCSTRKGSSLCPNPFKGFTLRSENFEGLKGVGDQTTVSWSALLRHYTEVASSCKESAQRIMGARSVHQLYPSKSFIPKGPLKWLILSTLVWNDTSIWRPWSFSLRSALRRAIYPVWNAPYPSSSSSSLVFIGGWQPNLLVHYRYNNTILWLESPWNPSENCTAAQCCHIQVHLNNLECRGKVHLFQ